MMPPIENTVFINVPIEKVFKCLTTEAGWEAWFTSATTINLEGDKSILFKWEDFGVEKMTMQDGGEILEYEPPHVFSFRWYPIKEGSVVKFSLKQKGEGTILNLKENGYPDDETQALIGCATGWGEAMILLKFYLEHGLVYGEIP